ncbi:DUF6904 family protein [Sulfobacillus harzensis]|uniref:Uncharacterized protein n=1 Tax=Sulfobacillus harzensis TaxID=2729629 RepID=A0A7Y0L289_9FIRM|nr:hypothetical protein [Sulfobacillus harzensis]NMP21880.1 hypothetical protein [Sulfobacillus harzensis]
MQNTPNLAGIRIAGDYQDLESLYMALHAIVGEDGEYQTFDSARLRVLGVCYDIRHAFQGDREVEFVPNHMDRERMRWHGIIAPEQNLYYKVSIYYPELLFVVSALNQFIRLTAKKMANSARNPLTDKRAAWDGAIAQVRLFQSQVAKCLKEAVTDASYHRMMTLMHRDYPWMEEYMDQYLDLLNIRYLYLESREERQRALLTTVKRMVERGAEYQDLVRDIWREALAQGCRVDELTLVKEYPDDIAW